MRNLLLLSLALSLTLGCSGAQVAPPDSGRDAALASDTGSSEDAATAGDTGAGDTGADGSPRDGSTGPDSGALYAGSFVSNTCGPADGPAILITLYGAPGPRCGAAPDSRSLSFYIHDLGGATLPPSSGETITSTAAASDGTANECPGGSPPCRVSEEWSVTFTAYDPAGGASGQYSITWGDGTMSSGAFDATRCTSPAICG